ncbi:MAG TPA: hypothetical protein VEK55_11165, partial [Xanthobacteraceae bacterium]|nr:hypothetical protein [Xanthobacteraceae bacterium]
LRTTLTALGQRWGWDRRKVRTRLDRWQAAGHVMRTVLPGGASTIVATPTKLAVGDAEIRPGPAPAGTVPSILARRAPMLPEEVRDGAPLVSPPDPQPSPAPAEAAPPGLRPVPAAAVAAIAGRLFWTVTVGAVAAAIAWYGVRLNAWYGGTLGKTSEAQDLFAGGSVCVDLLAILLPDRMVAFWVERRFGLATVALLMWLVTVAMAVLASAGFAGVNIADTSAARAKAAAESAGLSGRIERLRTERAAINEIRSVGSIEAALRDLQVRFSVAWRATQNCTNGDPHALVCAAARKLQGALEAARHRDELEQSLTRSEARLAALPPIGAADPQADATARLLRWLSHGALSVSPDDVGNARLLAMVVWPQLAGIAFMLAMAPWRHKRRPSAN